ncbi:MAG: ATP-binding protein [bacterium]
MYLPEPHQIATEAVAKIVVELLAKGVRPVVNVVREHFRARSAHEEIELMKKLARGQADEMTKDAIATAVLEALKQDGSFFAEIMGAIQSGRAESKAEHREIFERLDKILEKLSPPTATVPSVGDSFPEPPHLFGREQDYEQLKDYLCSRKPPVIQLIGQSGVGKTALAAAVVRDLRLPYLRLELHGESPEAVANRLFEIFHEQPAPPKPHADIVAWVVSKWQERGCLLVLDNLHCLLKADATPKDDAAKLFLQRLGEAGGQFLTLGWPGNGCAGNEPRAGGQVGAQGHQGRARREEAASRKSERHTKNDHARKGRGQPRRQSQDAGDPRGVDWQTRRSGGDSR